MSSPSTPTRQVPLDPSTPKRSYRLRTTEAELASFTRPMGGPKTNSRELPGRIDIGCQVPQPDEVPTRMNRSAWEAVKKVAARYGVEVSDSVSPADGRKLGFALIEAVKDGRDDGLGDTIRVIVDEVLAKGKGLRAR